MAVNCGTPTPAITLVVQLAPAPIPTFTQSTPASIIACVPSPVATLPAIKDISGCEFLILSIESNTSLEWPCAVSMTIASTSTLASCAALSKASPETPIAAPTLRRPFLSLHALG